VCLFFAWDLLENYAQELGPVEMFPESLPATGVLQALVAAAAITICAGFVRRRYFSPLSDIPGPFVASFSASLWHLWHIWKGHVEVAVIEQHQKHGPSSPPRLHVVVLLLTEN
jgi:hypothetical protein